MKQPLFNLNTKKALLCLFFLCVCCDQAYAQVKKRFYIGNDDHTDYMWAGDVAQYDSAFVKMLDFQIRKIDSTKNNPADFQVRFNCDGSYWIRTYERYRSPQQFQKLIDALRSEHITSPVTSLVNCYGAQPTEAVIRGMFYAGRLERAYGLRFTLANAMENNTQPLGLASLWAGAGAKYSWKGSGGYGSQLSRDRRVIRKFQLYRATGLDSAGVLTKWYSLPGKSYGGIGGYAECRLTLKKTDVNRDMDKVIGYLEDFTHDPSYPYLAAAAFGYGHDDLSSFVADPFLDVARKQSNSIHSVRISNEVDFFRDIEKNYPQIPVQAVTFGNEWDVLCASMNETTAKVRRATEKLRSAEALASIVSFGDTTFALGLKNMRDLAWDGFGMYWEHNWTGDGPVSQAKRAAWQKTLQQNICDYIDTLHTLSAQRLGNEIAVGSYPRFYAFNPLGWQRSGTADFPYSGSRSVKVIDLSSGIEVPSQMIQKEGKDFLRAEVSSLPSVGYHILEIRPSQALSIRKSRNVINGWVSNRYYKIRISKSGAITQIFDKIAKRQIVAKIRGRYLNDLGTADLEKGDQLVVENEGAVSTTYKAVSNDPVAHTTRITLFRNNPKIEIQNTIDENFKDVKTWAFSLNLNQPETKFEELGAIITAKKVSHGGHYSDQNARFDWQTFNHFADLSEKNYGVTISNTDCSFFKLGSSTVDSLDEGSSQLNALAGGQVDRKVEDHGLLGIHDQNGQKSFHYKFAIIAHQGKLNPLEAMKFAMEDQNSIVTGSVRGKRSVHPGMAFSLMRISDPNTVIWSIKPSEDGFNRGLIARLWNFSPQKKSTEVTLWKPVEKATQCSHIETDIRPAQVSSGKASLSLNGFQIGTYRLLTH